MKKETIEALEEALSLENSLNAKTEIVCDLAYELRNIDPLRSQNLAIEAYTYLNEVEKPVQGKIHLVQAHRYYQLDDFRNCIQQLDRARDIFESLGESEDLTKVLNLYGIIHSLSGMHADAMDNFTKALRYASRTEDPKLQTVCWNNIGYLLLEMKRPDEAIHFLERSYTISKKHNFKKTLFHSCDNLAQIYMNKQDFKQAHTYAKRALNYCEETGYPRGKAEIFSTLGALYLAEGKYKWVLYYAEKAREAASAVNYQSLVVNAMLLKAKGEFMLDKMEESSQTLLGLLDYAGRMDVKRDFFEAYLLFYRIYKQKGDYHRAMEALEEHGKMREEYLDQYVNNQISSLTLIYEMESEEKDAEILRLKNAMLLREVEIHKRTQEELEKQAHFDPLTEIYNRRYFYDTSADLVRKLNQLGQEASMIMIDLDHFKQINDSFGHLIGDEVLVVVAKRIKTSLRDADIACRFGGEEFVILLPYTDLESASKVAQRLQDSIARDPIMVNNKAVTITMSIGISHQTGPDIVFDRLMDQADKALYQAKNLGRNRVVLSNGEGYREDFFQSPISPG